MEDEKPKTSHLVLKPKEIVPTDAPSRPGDGTALSVRLIHQQNAILEAKALRDARRAIPHPPQLPDPGPAPLPVFKPKTFEAVNARTREQDAEAIRVADILRENKLAEDGAGIGRIEQRRRRVSRRRRDYLLIVGCAAVLLGIVLKAAPGPLTTVFGFGALTLLAVTLGWVMFFVMDPY